MNATLLNCLKSHELADPLAEDEAEQLASALSDSSRSQVYPRSISCARNAVFFLGRQGSNKSLGIIPPIRTAGMGFQGNLKRSILTGIL